MREKNGLTSPLIREQKLWFFSKIIYTGFSWFFLLWFAWLFVSLCFFNNSTFEYNIWIQNAAALGLACAVALAYAAFQRLRRQKKPVIQTMRRRFLLIFLSGMLLIFVLQMIYIGLTTTSIGWDVATLVRHAKAPDMGTTTVYFQHYPNNLFLLLFFRFFVLVFHFLKLPGVWAGLNVINTIAVDVAIILTVLIARRLFGHKGAYISWFFSTITIAFFPYLIVPYSDTLGMPFAIAVFYCYLRICDAGRQKERVFFSIFMGLCTCVGFLIKPTLIIPLIAVILIHLLYNIKNKKALFKSAFYFALVAVTLVTANTTYQSFAKSHFPRDEEMKTPVTHFAMMGLREMKLPNGTSMYGAYYKPDVDATFARPDQETKIQYNLDVIKERLTKMGVGGYLSFLNNKARWITSEGNFFWGGEGRFANYDYMMDSFLKECINSGSNRLGFYMKEDGKTQPGKYYGLYFYFSQAVWILLLFCLVVPLFLRKKGTCNKDVLIMRCSIFGLMLFLLLFEARSRYLINQLPYFILLASYGLTTLTGQIENRKKKTNKYKRNNDKNRTG